MKSKYFVIEITDEGRFITEVASDPFVGRRKQLEAISDTAELPLDKDEAIGFVGGFTGIYEAEDCDIALEA